MSVADQTPRKLALNLASELISQARNQPVVVGDGGLDEDMAIELKDLFNVESALVGRSAGNGRNEREYWEDHGRVTAHLMTTIARHWGGCSELYARVGELHDVDYLVFPHDAPGHGERHPVPLVRAMASRNVHPAICLAVLEHAPYVGRCDRPTSRLSAALSTAEDIATLAALTPRATNLDRLSREAQDLFAIAAPRCEITRHQEVRVETNIDRFINEPLALVIRGSFEFVV